jgi:hypothetical protein
MSQIVKALFALRNLNGGVLVIGFQDNPVRLDRTNAPSVPRTVYHADVIARLVARFASEPFATQVQFHDVGGIEVPVVQVPAGMISPVVTKSDLYDGTNHLIRANRIYYRTIASNGTPSSSEIGYADWPDLLETCLDNREANIGRFLRRHIASIDPVTFGDGLRRIMSASQDVLESDSRAVLNAGRSAFERAIAGRQLQLPSFGTYEVAASIRGNLPSIPLTDDLLMRIRNSNPRHSGWPPWVVLYGGDESNHPYVYEAAWEALIWIPHSIIDRWSLDFWRFDPMGRLYLLRALDDDTRIDQGGAATGTVLDPRLLVIRLAEAVLVVRAFAKELAPRGDWSVDVTCRWRGLTGRQLHVWSNPSVFFSGGQRAVQNEVSSSASFPGDAAPESIASAVESLTREVLAVFGGFVVPSRECESLTREVIGRRY